MSNSDSYSEDSNDESNENKSLRFYDLQFEIERLITDNKKMNIDEIRGATIILSYISEYLYDLYFQKRVPFCRRVLVKTIEEIYEISYQELDHLERKQLTRRKSI